ncbi:MAG TPA: flagellar motor protein [Candidatus Deferrimicrobiaceae bacterium]
MDLSAIIGIICGVGAILLGQALEGGSIKSLIQPTAFIIVIGGALGATLASFPLSAAKMALGALRKVFFSGADKGPEYVQEIIRYAAKARKNGIISLEADIKVAKDPFLQKALRFVVDGVDPKVLQGIMETELNKLEEEGEIPVKFFEAFGGYLPTIGIIGAVLGLIQVMQNLNDPSKLGEGIAVAFVATVYGLVAANIFMFPWAGKLKIRHKEEMTIKAMILEGVLAMQAGEHPQIIEERLKAYINMAEPKKK